MSSATNENKTPAANPLPPSSRPLTVSPGSRRSPEFRFIVNFGPQLSTPCSRCLGTSPQPLPAVVHASTQLFHRYLRCHTFTL